MNVKRRFNVLKWKIIIIIVVVISVDVGSRNEAEIKRILGPLIAGYVLGIALARSQKSHQNSPRKIFVVSPYPLGFFKKKSECSRAECSAFCDRRESSRFFSVDGERRLLN